MATEPSAPPANDQEKREYVFKVLVVGELGTGKTSVVKRYVHSNFSEHYRTTIGVDFALKILKGDNDTIIRLQLWDIGGQERFGSMTRVYYKDAVGCIIVFDAARPSTFDTVSKWKADLDNKVQLSNGNPLPCILLANKCDLVRDGSANDVEQMDHYCKDKGFEKWFKTSAKENINIETSIKYLIDEMIKHTRVIEPSVLDRPIILGGKTNDLLEPNAKDRAGCCSGNS